MFICVGRPAARGRHQRPRPPTPGLAPPQLLGRRPRGKKRRAARRSADGVLAAGVPQVSVSQEPWKGRRPPRQQRLLRRSSARLRHQRSVEDPAIIKSYARTTYGSLQWQRDRARGAAPPLPTALLARPPRRYRPRRLCRAPGLCRHGRRARDDV